MQQWKLNKVFIKNGIVVRRPTQHRKQYPLIPKDRPYDHCGVCHRLFGNYRDGLQRIGAL